MLYVTACNHDVIFAYNEYYRTKMAYCRETVFIKTSLLRHGLPLIKDIKSNETNLFGWQRSFIHHVYKYVESTIYVWGSHVSRVNYICVNVLRSHVTRVRYICVRVPYNKGQLYVWGSYVNYICVNVWRPHVTRVSYICVNVWRSHVTRVSYICMKVPCNKSQLYMYEGPM